MIAVIDFETHWATDFSIKKLGSLNYIRDPRFKVHGVGIKLIDELGESNFWITDGIAGWLNSMDWSEIDVIGHNLLFDGTILNEVYGIRPRRYINTLSMARAIFPPGVKLSLGDVGKALGLGGKFMAGALADTKGKLTLTDEELNALGRYCLEGDVELTWAVYQKLRPLFPKEEMDLIHITDRMGCVPVFEVDLELSQQALEEATAIREKAIAESGYTATQLGSNPQFAKILRSLNIEPPTKVSKTTEEETEAFGKNDPEFIELMLVYPEHKKLWEGRLASKSTIGVSRAKKWIEIGTRGCRLLPMPYNYFGAHTGRWSGTNGINVQNLPRGGKLRKAIRAPKGYAIVVSDSAQIELRMNLWFAGQLDRLDVLRNGGDTYRLTAGSFFGVDPTAVNKDQRQFGKVQELGCGFGMGGKKFQHFCASGPLGMDPVYISLEEAMRGIHVYRTVNHKVAEMWKILDGLIPLILSKEMTDFKCLRIGDMSIELPNGMRMDYSGLHATEEGWKYGMGKKIKSLWGGTLDENIVQALARVVIGEKMLEVDRIEDTQIAGCTHDELIAVCPLEIADDVATEMHKIMSISPAWAPDLPLSAETGWAKNYSK